MNTLDPSDLDAETKARLTRHIADVVAEEITHTTTHTDPGDAVLYVNEWWADVLTDGYNEMARIPVPGPERESITGLHLHGVPVEHDESARVPTVSEPRDTPVWERPHSVTCPTCEREYGGDSNVVMFPGSCDECGADLTDVLPTVVDDA